MEDYSPIVGESLIDSSIITHQSISSSLSTQERASNEIDEISSKITSKFPMVSYIQSKKESDILFQHPLILKMKDLKMTDELKNVSRDMVNKWYENTSLKNYYISLYSKEIFMNESNLIDSYSSYLSVIQKELKDKMSSISKDQTLQSNFMIVKIGLNNLNSISLDNLDDLVKYSKVINDYFSSFFEKHYELIFLFGKDLFKIFFKIDKLINTSTFKNPEIPVKLLNIIYHLSSCFKSLYGYLFLIDQIQKQKLEQYYSVDKIMDCMVNVNYLTIKGSGLVEQKNLFIDYIKEHFVVDNTSGVYAQNDFIFLYNSKFGIMKVHRLEQNNNSYNCIKHININYSKTALFSFDEKYIFTFSYENYKNDKEDNVIEVYDFNLNKSPVSLIYDNKAKMLLYNTGLEHYFNYLSKKENVKYNESSSSSNIAVYSEDKYLYIIHPLCDIPKEKDDFNFYSSKYIYALDIFEINYQEDAIKISFFDTQILQNKEKISDKTKDDKKTFYIDELFSSTTSLNKFIVINGQIISSKGLYLYNTKDKKFVINDNQSTLFTNIDTSSTSNLTLSHNNNILILNLEQDDAPGRFKVKERSYKSLTYQKSNEFTNSSLYQKVIENSSNSNKISMNTEDIMEEVFNVNYMDMYTQSSDSKIEDSETNEEEEISNHPSMIKYILACLCQHINFTQYHTIVKNEDISKHIKAPYVLCNDNPTLNLIEELLRNNMDNIDILFSLLMLFDNQILQMINLKISSKAIFGSEKKVEDFISLLYYLGKNHKEIENICFCLIIKMISVSDFYEGEKLNHMIQNIFFDKDSITLENKFDIYQTFFTYIKLSKKNIENVLNTKNGKELTYKVLECLLQKETNSKNSIIYEKVCKEYEKFFIYLYAFLMNDRKYDNEWIELTSFTLKQIIRNLSNAFKGDNEISTDSITKKDFISSSIITIPLLKYITLTTLNDFKNKDTKCTFNHWALYLEIIEFISNYKSSLSEKAIHEKDKHDIIIDNLSFTNGQSKSLLYKDSSCENKIKLYIESILISKVKSSKRIKGLINIGNIADYSNNNTLYSFSFWSNDNTFNSSYDTLYNVNVKEGIKISLNQTAKDYLVKIRISNYKFYNEEIDTILNPLVELFNNMLKTLSFYSGRNETDISSEERLLNDNIMNLFVTRLFSQGITQNHFKNSNNNDITLFNSCLEKASSRYYALLKEKINFLKVTADEEIISTSIKEKTDSIEQFINSKELNETLSYFDSKIRIIIKGDIPDKIVRYAFYVILRHENILEQFISFSKTFNVSKKENEDSELMFLIWKECSELRRAYKGLKDEFINNNLDVDKEFNEIYKKFIFLYELIPQIKISPLISQKLNKSVKIKPNLYKPSIQIVKEHIINITEIIQNKKITINNLLKGYENMQTKAKFREISILIINTILKDFNDNSIKCNILTNFYNTFAKGDNSKKIPSIYESLMCIGEKLVQNITDAFHILLNTIQEKIQSQEMSKFDLSVYLNFLLWKIRKRNFKFFVNNDVFNLFENPINLEKANKFLFIVPETISDINDKFSEFSEIRPIDDCHLGKILTDIFCYYSNRIIQLEMSSNSNRKGSTDTQKAKDELNLARMNSYNEMESYSNIFENIVDAFDYQLEKIKKVFKIPDVSYIDKDYSFPFDEKNFESFEKKMIQTKLYNVLNEFNKICISQYEKNNTIFKFHSLWSSLVSLIKYSNYKNTRLIFSLLKMFTKIEKDNLSFFYDKIKRTNSENFEFAKYYEHILLISPFKNIICDYFIFVYYNIDKQSIEDFITDKIVNDKRTDLLKFFSFDISNLYHFSPVIVNSKLTIENKTINYLIPKANLDLLIKKGYYLVQSVIKESANVEKDEDEEENLENDSENYSDDYRSDDDNDEGSNEKPKNIFDMNKNNTLNREIPILMNDISNNQINYLIANENEIVYDDRYLYCNVDENNTIIPNDKVVSSCVDYLSENLFNLERISPKLILDYVRIIKCCIKMNKTEKVKEFIENNKEKIEKLLNLRLPNNAFSLLFKEKIENFLAKSIMKLKENVYSEEKKNFFNQEEAITDEKGMNKVTFAVINTVEKTKNVSIFNKTENKFILPIEDHADVVDTLDSLEEVLYRVDVLNKEEYEKLKNEYDKMDDIEKNTISKNREERKYYKNRVIILCDDLIKNLGVSEYAYKDKERDLFFFQKKDDSDSESSEGEESETPKKEKKRKSNSNSSVSNSSVSSKSKKSENEEEDKIEGEDEWSECSGEEEGEEISEKEIEESQKKTDKEEESDEDSEADNLKKNLNEKIEKNKNKKQDKKKKQKKKENEDDNKKKEEEDDKEDTRNTTMPTSFKDKSWEQFTLVLRKYYQLYSCVFLVESSNFTRIPLNINCFSYESSQFPTKDLSPSNLYKRINEQTKRGKESIPDLILSTVLHQKGNSKKNGKKSTKDNKFGDLYTMLCDSYKIKQKNETKTKINDRFLEDKETFYTLYESSPSLNDITDSKDEIINTGIYIIKYYMRILLLLLEKPVSIESLKFMFFCTFYYQNYYNLSCEFDIIKKGLYRYLDVSSNEKDVSYLIKTNKVINYQTSLINEKDLDSKIQDYFIKEIFSYYKSKNNSSMIHELVGILIEKVINQFEENKLEDGLIVLDIIRYILSTSDDKEIFKKLTSSPLISLILPIAVRNKKMIKTDFSIYCLEFLLQLLIYAKEHNYEDYKFDDDLIQMYKDYDIVKNKFNSTLLIENLSKNNEEYKKETLISLTLPKSETSPYAIRLKKDFVSSYAIQPLSSKTNQTMLSLLEMENNAQNAKIIENEIETSTNDIVILNESRTSMKSFVVKDLKEIRNENIQNIKNDIEVQPSIVELYTLNRDTTIGKDVNGKYYTFGFIPGGSRSTKTKSFVLSQDINKINETDPIINIFNNVILTKTALYFTNQTYPEDLETSRFSEAFRKYTLRTAEKIKKVEYYPCLIILTEKGTMYGARGQVDSYMITGTDEDSGDQVVEIKIPENLIILDFVIDYSVFVYLAYDKNLNKNVIYANGNNTSLHMFDREITENFFAKEVTFFSDKNITNIYLSNQRYFIAYSEEGKIYYLDKDKYEKYGFSTLDFFNSNNLKLVDIQVIGRGVVFNTQKENDSKIYHFFSGDCDNIKNFTVEQGRDRASNFNNPVLIDIEEFEKDKDKKVKKNQIIHKQLAGILYSDYQIYGLIDIYTPFITMNSFTNSKSITNEDEKMKFVLLTKEGCFNIELVSHHIEKNNHFYLFNFSKNEDCKEKLNENEEIKFIDQSKSPSVINAHLIQRLSKFALNPNHLNQLLITETKDTIKNLPTTANKSEFTFTLEEVTVNTENLNIYITPNEKAPKKYKELLDKLFNCTQKDCAELNEDYITEYLISKQFYLINKKTINKTLDEYLIGKYHNYDKYQKMSEPRILNLVSKVTKEIIRASKTLLNNSSIITNTFFSDVIFNNMQYIDKEIRDKYFNKNFKMLKTVNQKFKIQISRSLSMKNKSLNLVDTNYEWTIFSQLYNILRFSRPNYFLKPKQANLFTVNLEGENAVDAGGPFREIINSAFEELNSPHLDLFIPTPNNTSKAGSDRDKYTINPQSKSEKQLKIFEFIGKLFAYIISTEVYMPLSLPSFVYKQILDMPINAKDIELIDIHSYNSIIKVLTSGTKKQKESLYGIIDFTCQLSNGEIVELVPGGKNIMLNEENSSQFLDLYIKVRSTECSEQAQSIRKGLTSVIPEQILKFLTWEDLEQKICGEPFFNLELLKSNTRYEGFNQNSQTVKFFWKFLESCTLEEQYLYLKFSWGRTRLPKDDSGFMEDKHTLCKMEIKEDEVNKKLPMSHTCFFTVDIPPYTSYEILKEKLMYAMRNSLIITDSDSVLNLDI